MSLLGTLWNAAYQAVYVKSYDGNSYNGPPLPSHFNQENM